MGAPAKIDEASHFIAREACFGFFLDQFTLEVGALPPEPLQSFRLVHPKEFEGIVGLNQLVHPLLDFLQFLGRKGGFTLEVVEETVLYGRTNPQLGPRIKFSDRKRQQVRGTVTINLQCFGVPFGQDLHRRVTIEAGKQIHQATIHLGNQGSLGQPPAEGSGYIQHSHPGFESLLPTIGKRHCDLAHFSGRSMLKSRQARYQTNLDPSIA